MTINTAKKIAEIIDDLSMERHPATLDDDISDMLAESEQESAQILVNYIKKSFLGE